MDMEAITLWKAVIVSTDIRHGYMGGFKLIFALLRSLSNFSRRLNRSTATAGPPQTHRDCNYTEAQPSIDVSP